jgi:hypothetical protein
MDCLLTAHVDHWLWMSLIFLPCVYKLKITNTSPAAKLDTNGKRLEREIRG